MTAYASFTWCLVFFAFGTFVTSRFIEKRSALVICGLALVLTFFLLEFAEYRPITYVRGWLPEPSVALLLVSLFYCVRAHFTNQFINLNPKPVYSTVLLLGIPFYPMALGLSWFDPYSLGYNPLFGLLIFLISLVAWLIPSGRVIAFWMSFALLVNSWSIGESSNLWDQLFDPVVFILSTIWGVRSLKQKLVQIDL